MSCAMPPLWFPVDFLIRICDVNPLFYHSSLRLYRQKKISNAATSFTKSPVIKKLPKGLG
jgi:hypothetical protein